MCVWATVKYDIDDDRVYREPSCRPDYLTAQPISGWNFCPYCGDVLESELADTGE